MIEIKNVTKNFDGYEAVSHMNLTIESGIVYGMLGTNGAGKSTLLRMISGVMKPDEGEVLFDGQNVYDNPQVKSKLFFISDDQYFVPHSNANSTAEYLKVCYPNFDKAKFDKLMTQFGLDGKRKIDTFSKGMKKQLAILLGICCNTEYLLCDETFDGLDSVMRQAVKSLFAKEMSERDFTPVIASHNLREIEDICDTVGLLHKGGVLMAKDVDDAKEDLKKIQCVFRQEEDFETFSGKCKVINDKKNGSMHLMIVRDSEETIHKNMEELKPVYYEILSLSLEEVFICETEVVGYDIKKLIMED